MRNAIDSATAQRLHDEFVAFDEDEGAKVAVLRRVQARMVAWIAGN